MFEYGLNMFYRICEEVMATLRRYERVEGKGKGKDNSRTLSAYAKRHIGGV